MKAEQHYKD